MTAAVANQKMNLFGVLKGVTYFAAAGASITNGFAADRMILTSNVQTLPRADFLLKQAPVIDFRSTIQEMQQNGLPVSIIASIMRVERKTVYAWMKDAQPRRDAVDRLALVYPALKSAFGNHLRTAHRLWNTKDRSSVTLESLLTAPAIDVAAAEQYLATFASAIRRYAAQDAAAMPSARGGNALLDEMPIVDFDRT